MSIRVDLEATANDRMNWRYWQDRGSQPTFTDPINPVFNVTKPFSRRIMVSSPRPIPSVPMW